MSEVNNYMLAFNPALLDSFGRQRTSDPSYVFDAQFTYDLAPLLYEPLINLAGGGGGTVTITHDATNRNALLTLAAANNGAYARMQTYEFFRYQPGRSQLIFTTFNMVEKKANVTKYVGYTDGTNGVELQVVGITAVNLVCNSATTLGTETVPQASWNIDPLNGSGPSALTLDFTTTQIMVIDFQALYVGRIRVGFVIGGSVYYCHQFNHANLVAYPYAQTMNLPLRAGMTATAGGVSSTMTYVCASVISEGGDAANHVGYSFSATSGAITAGSGTRTLALSLRPKTTFNSITNRSKFVLKTIDAVVTSGTVPIYWELCVGTDIATSPAFTDVNATYSAMQYYQAGTINSGPLIVLESGFIAASAQTRGQVTQGVSLRTPITLDAAGAVRLLGTLSLLVTGIGSTSPCRVAMNWREER